MAVESTGKLSFFYDSSIWDVMEIKAWMSVSINHSRLVGCYSAEVFAVLRRRNCQLPESPIMIGDVIVTISIKKGADCEKKY
jgi:hypothetical protein